MENLILLSNVKYINTIDLLISLDKFEISKENSSSCNIYKKNHPNTIINFFEDKYIRLDYYEENEKDRLLLLFGDDIVFVNIMFKASEFLFLKEVFHHISELHKPSIIDNDNLGYICFDEIFKFNSFNDLFNFKRDLLAL